MFVDVEEFRESLVLFHINAEFKDSDPASAAQLVSSRGSNSSESAPPTDVQPTSASDAECAAIVGSASAVLLEMTDHLGIDGEYIAWLAVPTVAEAMRQSYKASEQAHVESASSYLEATGRRLLATVPDADFMRRIISVSCGFGLTPDEQSWKTVAGDSVCIATYLHVAVVSIMTTPLFPQRTD